jgi:hypothetical protein
LRRSSIGTRHSSVATAERDETKEERGGTSESHVSRWTGEFATGNESRRSAVGGAHQPQNGSKLFSWLAHPPLLPYRASLFCNIVTSRENASECHCEFLDRSSLPSFPLRLSEHLQSLCTYLAHRLYLMMREDACATVQDMGQTSWEACGGHTQSSNEQSEVWHRPRSSSWLRTCIYVHLEVEQNEESNRQLYCIDTVSSGAVFRVIYIPDCLAALARLYLFI